jgi:hypothetical protein
MKGKKRKEDGTECVTSLDGEAKKTLAKAKKEETEAARNRKKKAEAAFTKISGILDSHAKKLIQALKDNENLLGDLDDFFAHKKPNEKLFGKYGTKREAFEAMFSRDASQVFRVLKQIREAAFPPAPSPALTDGEGEKDEGEKDEGTESEGEEGEKEEANRPRVTVPVLVTECVNRYTTILDEGNYGEDGLIEFFRQLAGEAIVLIGADYTFEKVTLKQQLSALAKLAVRLKERCEYLKDKIAAEEAAPSASLDVGVLDLIPPTPVTVVSTETAKA